MDLISTNRERYFSTDGKNPATLSFLAPSQDFDRTVTRNQKKSMAVISAIYNVLKTQILIKLQDILMSFILLLLVII